MHTPIDRERLNAKLLTYENRQVLAYLFRNEDDVLCVALHLWVAVTDEQFRAVVNFGDDKATNKFLVDLNDPMLAAVLQQMGVPEQIARLEEALA